MLRVYHSSTLLNSALENEADEAKSRYELLDKMFLGGYVLIELDDDDNPILDSAMHFVGAADGAGIWKEVDPSQLPNLKSRRSQMLPDQVRVRVGQTPGSSATRHKLSANALVIMHDHL
jgi:hypothetical protein